MTSCTAPPSMTVRRGRDPAVIPAQGANTINTGTLSHSDSAAVIAFGNGSPSTVGVMWSDQDGLPAATDNGYYFATIAAGADPTLAGNWTKVELPKLAGLTNDESDNHINMKATSDGRLFMVGKARTDTVACATNKQRPLVPFFARTAGGAWSTHLAGTVGDCNTRPQVVISEQLDVAYLLMTSPNGGGAVYTKSAPLSGADSFDFRGAADQTIQRGTPFIRSATETLIDDPSTTKQPVTDASGIVAIANNLTSSAGGNVKVFLHNSMAIPATDSTDPAGTVSINGGAGATSSSDRLGRGPGDRHRWERCESRPPVERRRHERQHDVRLHDADRLDPDRRARGQDRVCPVARRRGQLVGHGERRHHGHERHDRTDDAGYPDPIDLLQRSDRLPAQGLLDGEQRPGERDRSLRAVHVGQWCRVRQGRRHDRHQPQPRRHDVVQHVPVRGPRGEWRGICRARSATARRSGRSATASQAPPSRSAAAGASRRRRTSSAARPSTR